MTKKLAIIGQGTAGAFSLTHYLKWTDWEIDWYFDNNIPTQAVGEGSNLALPSALYENVGFTHTDLEKIDGSFKFGIDKQNWGASNYIHTFAPPNISYHFNAKKFQQYIYENAQKLTRVGMIDNHVVDPHSVDADYVLDCSGKPSDMSLFNTDLSIPVNSVYVTQCYWDKIEFQKTLTIARPYGWVFGIPLKNRCSIGYLYNNKINTLDEVKEDVKHIFQEWNLVPSQDTNSFKFDNYYRKNNFDGRVIHNGNSSFFLEPLEATSLGFMRTIQQLSLNYWGDNNSLDCNAEYKKQLSQIETMIMMHYYAGSKFKSQFWDYAQEKAIKHIENSIKTDFDFKLILKCALDNRPTTEYGSWGVHSFRENLNGLGLVEDFRKMLNI